MAMKTCAKSARFASRELRSHRPTSNVLSFRGIPCGRACRRWNRGRLLCREDSRARSTERMPSPDTDPNRTKFSDSDHHHIGLRSSGTVGGEGTRPAARRRYALCSSRIVTVPHEAAKDAPKRYFHFKSCLTSNRMHSTGSTRLARSLRKFLRTAVKIYICRRSAD